MMEIFAAVHESGVGTAGRGDRHRQSPVTGHDRTCRKRAVTAEFDPRWTLIQIPFQISVKLYVKDPFYGAFDEGSF